VGRPQITAGDRSKPRYNVDTDVDTGRATGGMGGGWLKSHDGTRVAAAKGPTRLADGGGLYLRVTPAGSKLWVFLARFENARPEVGLGNANGLSLADARVIAGQMREAVAKGLHPKTVLTKEEAVEPPARPTFGAFAETYIADVEGGWKNAVHRKQWRQTLADHAGTLKGKAIDEIDTDDVLGVLKPIWLTKAETAKRVRGRIEKILDAAKARGLRPRDSMNPATWRGHLALLLPSQSKLPRGHHAALPWKEAPTFIKALRQREALAARCLEFVILTAARSGEVLEAEWGEVDLEARLWTVPATRMKAGAEHSVPLSSASVAILERLRPADPKASDPIFAIGGATRSNMAMAMLLRRMGTSDVTTHGFRSTFRDWAGDATDHPRELIEQALAHTVQNKAERAYRRGTAIDRRRKIMDDWAEYLIQASTAAIDG
jgi:integrase